MQQGENVIDKEREKWKREREGNWERLYCSTHSNLSVKCHCKRLGLEQRPENNYSSAVSCINTTYKRSIIATVVPIIILQLVQMRLHCGNKEWWTNNTQWHTVGHHCRVEGTSLKWGSIGLQPAPSPLIPTPGARPLLCGCDCDCGMSGSSQSSSHIPHASVRHLQGFCCRTD